MTGFEDRVRRTEREFGELRDFLDTAASVAATEQLPEAERRRNDEAAAQAFADLLEEVSRTLHSRGARVTRQPCRVPRYGVAKTRMGRFDFHTRTFKGWILGSGFRQIWIEVGGGHWTDDRDMHHIYLATVRRARDPAPVHAVYQMDGSWRRLDLSVLPRDVTWSAAGGFRLVYTHYGARDAPATYVDADYEEVLAEAVATAPPSFAIFGPVRAQW